MPVINSIAAQAEDMTAWRRDFHAHPEIAFEEHRTAAAVAEKLAGWGIEVHRGVAKTGVVGVLHGDRPGPAADGGVRAIGLRADMDALPMNEANDLPWASRHDGACHACGHDGHTTMLLGAARYLAETRNFAGTVHFIFQPGEEGAAGARHMIEDGLFARFPCDEVYALHNWPDMPAGAVGLRPGPIMAAADVLDITVTGRGGHAAMPHKTTDPVPVAAQIITALQSLVARRVDPFDPTVVTIAEIHAGTAFNVIPETVMMRGTVRTVRADTRDFLEAEIGRVVSGIAVAMGATAETTYRRGYPVTINHDMQTAYAADIAAEVVGADRVDRDVTPGMGAEDFSYMLLQRPGAYLWLGQGGGPSTGGLHSPHYDFNDDILPVGASLFARLVERRLA